MRWLIGMAIYGIVGRAGLIRYDIGHLAAAPRRNRIAPIVAPHFGRISSYDPRRERGLLNSVLLAVVAGVCVLGFPSAQTLDAKVASFFPVRAVEFLRAHPEQGHLFNLYQWGGYLEWNLPQTQTFIDSRSDIFDHTGVLNDYLDVITLSNSQELLDRYKIEYVLYPTGPALPYFLSRSPQWDCMYDDGQSVIYRRLPRQARNP